MTNWDSEIVTRRDKSREQAPTRGPFEAIIRSHLQPILAGVMIVVVVAVIGVTSLYQSHQEFTAQQAELAREPFERVITELLISDDRSVSGKDIVVKETVEPRIAGNTRRHGIFVDVPTKLYGTEAPVVPEPLAATLNDVSIPILPSEQVKDSIRFKVGLPDIPLPPGRSRLGFQYRVRNLPLIQESGVEELKWRLNRPAQVITEAVSGVVTLPSYLEGSSGAKLPPGVEVSFWVQRDSDAAPQKDAVRWQPQFHVVPGSERGNWLLPFESTRPLGAGESVWVAVKISPEALRLN